MAYTLLYNKYIYKTCLLQERCSLEHAEGATTPETLRQKDCNEPITSGEKSKLKF